MQISFYGSTPNYAFVFEQVGFEGTTERIREKQKAGDLAGMASVISDDLLDHFVVTSDWDHLAGALIDRYDGVAHRLVSYFAGSAWQQNPESLSRWSTVAAGLAATRPGGGDR